MTQEARPSPDGGPEWPYWGVGYPLGCWDSVVVVDLSEQPRTLVVMRHSKAEHAGPSDMERELADRGLADAAEAGTWLAGRGIRPDVVLVSSAVRTRQTWQAVAEGAGWDVETAAYDDGLYDAGPETALDLLRSTDTEVRTAMVIGHNPTMAYLAQLLDDGDGDEEASGQMAWGFPTSAVVVLTYDGSWADLDEGGGRVVGFHVGRD